MTWSGGSFGARAVCVLAPNPTIMTLDGTNTWVLREPGARRSVVVDPGPEILEHLDAVAESAGEVAVVLLTHGHLDHSEAARTFAILGTAMADAGIVAWRAKYRYWLLRPSHADPAITMPIGLPNFPAYPSGHSSFSGAAEIVLGGLFPTEAAEVHRFAEENGLSRIYGGVHYSFDNTAGLEIGRRIAPLALALDGRLPARLLAAR